MPKKDKSSISYLVRNKVVGSSFIIFWMKSDSQRRIDFWIAYKAFSRVQK